MKSLRRTTSMPLIVNGMVFSELVLLIFIAVQLFINSTHTPKFQILFAITLASISFLCILSLVINYTFKNFQNESTAEIIIDQLTGLISRHVFGQVFTQILAEAKRLRQPLSLILLDIDRFRFVNEKHNHKTGDLLLTKLGATLQKTLRESDITCRWDGDEFLIILRDCGETNAEKIASKILNNISKIRVGSRNKPVKFTVSMGIAQMTSKDSIETLVERAQTGLCSARDNGRNTFAVGYDWILIDYYFTPIF